MERSLHLHRDDAHKLLLGKPMQDGHASNLVDVLGLELLGMMVRSFSNLVIEGFWLTDTVRMSHLIASKREYDQWLSLP